MRCWRMRRRIRNLEAAHDAQASVLYGAAHFTQDLDLWVDPSPANLSVLRLIPAGTPVASIL